MFKDWLKDWLDKKAWLDKLEMKIGDISSRCYTPRLFSLEWFLVGISWCYGLGVRIRLWLYEHGVFRKKKLPCFVISIGNIVVGGTGKTPMAVYIARIMKKMGKNPVVLSRGYKGKYNTDSLVVCDGINVLSNAGTAGDEPVMMAQRKAFPVVVGKDRFKAGIKAVEKFHPDVIILDDGFQHIKLERDLDLLLLDFQKPLGNNRFIPSGRLRETFDIAKKRADALIFTRSIAKDTPEVKINDFLSSFPEFPWFKTFHKPFVLKHIVHAKDLNQDVIDITGLKGKKVFLFSGLANNSVFFRSMEKYGVEQVGCLEFKDHYMYNDSDILMINAFAKGFSADCILTTEKDWAKFGNDIQWELDLVVIGIRIEFEDTRGFETFLSSRLKKSRLKK